MADTSRPQGRVVVKFGGSVLTGPASYRRAAQFLANRLCECPGERVLAIVSAEEGATDALLASARDLVCDPDPDTLDLLWSTGELRSVALLTLALQALGVHAAPANVHQTGLVWDADGPPDARRSAHPPARWRQSRLHPLRLRALLATADVVVAPGFLARAQGEAIKSLGRGGSDLTAVLLAAGLGATSCELLKDVPGYFDADPHAVPEAAHLPGLDYDAAVEMAEQGCGLVQLAALEAARDLNVRLVVRAMEGGRSTVVS